MANKSKQKIDNIPLEYEKAKKFFHCKSCVEKFLGSELHKFMTPKEYGMYEVGLHDFVYPDGTVGEIAAVWCKRCGDLVWDTRDYRKIN